MANDTMAVIRRCPRQGAALVYDAASGLWKCPRPGCYYAVPGDSPEETTEA